MVGRETPGVRGAWVALGIPQAKRKGPELWWSSRNATKQLDRKDTLEACVCTVTDWIRSQEEGEETETETTLPESGRYCLEGGRAFGEAGR